MLNDNNQSPGKRLAFDNFEVDLVTNELFRNGKRIELQEQPVRVLGMLLRHPQQMVTHEALSRTVWPESRFLNFEAGLYTAIRKLRIALDDNAEHPRYIETISRRGYRFIGPLQRGYPQTIDSIAVMPFSARGNEENVKYLSEGITESLIDRLSELPTLKRVTARSSVYRYEESELDFREIGKILGVCAVLTGTVTLRSDQVLVNTELLNTSDLHHVWGGSYCCDLAEISQLQEQIACEIAAELRLKFSRGAPALARANLAAYQLYLQGRHWWNKRPLRGAVQHAVEFFNQSIDKDSSFALSYAGLADSYNTLAAWESGIMAPNVAFPLARVAADRALQADPTLSEAHTSLAYAELHFGWNWQHAEQEFRHALTINPNNAACRHWYSHLLTAMGRIEESLAESLRIIELDPLNMIINVHMAWHYHMARQYDEALVQADRTLEMEPSFHWGYFFQGMALEQMQRADEAVDAFRKAVKLSDGSTVMLSALGHAYGAAGDIANALEILRRLNVMSHHQYISPYEVALIHASLGNNDLAFEWFDRACVEKSGWLPYLNRDPRLDRVRGDSRFTALVRAVGLPPMC